MFKKSKWKIVASIFFMLILLFAGTFGMIYLASYRQMLGENRRLLEQYVNEYRLTGEKMVRPPGDVRPEDPMDPPRLKLSTFYSVAISDRGEVLRVDTADLSIVDEDTLRELAFDILEQGKTDGVSHNLIYLVGEKEGYRLIAFLDNTVMHEGTRMLLNYTLIFGCIALVPLFFLARYLANRIVKPLEESYIRQKQFISDAGHELKTPVAVVNTNVELLSREIGENPWLSNIQYENNRMSELIIQLLDLARTEQVIPEMEPLDFSRLVVGEILPLETMAFERGILLDMQTEEEIRLCGNETQLKQLVSILLDNAIRHSPNGAQVSVCVKREKYSAVLSVANDGEMIPPDQQAHLFDRFYRSDTARTDGHHYGLGLSIAKTIADTHHGVIDVRCTDGKVVFSVSIPLEGKKKRRDNSSI